MTFPKEFIVGVDTKYQAYRSFLRLSTWRFKYEWISNPTEATVFTKLSNVPRIYH